MLLPPLPQGLLLDLIRPQLSRSLDAVSRAGLLSITGVLIWPVIIIRGHIPASWSKRKAYFLSAAEEPGGSERFMLLRGSARPVVPLSTSDQTALISEGGRQDAWKGTRAPVGIR